MSLRGSGKRKPGLPWPRKSIPIAKTRKSENAKKGTGEGRAGCGWDAPFAFSLFRLFAIF
jgi:hypothetical protein